MLMRVAEEAA